MNAIRKTRKELGLTQHALADLIGVSRSVVAMAECGYRNFPVNAAIKLGKLYLSSQTLPIAEAEPDAVTALENELQETMAALEETRSVRERLLEKAQAVLDKLEKGHAAAQQSLKLIAREKIYFAGVPTYLRKLERRFNDTMALFIKTHPKRQVIYRIRTAELRALMAITDAELIAHGRAPGQNTAT